ncbi:MAG: SDR family oxidoreductase [Pirellulaceae bacterium]|nr:SDR family oxidoreductase [Pirellulaceae bacterium]
MDLQLAGEVAVVVGGASGIGLAIAKEFARAGCRVGIIDRSPETPRLAGDVAAAGKTTSIGLVADVTDYAAVQEAARKSEHALDRVQHVVYAAGCGSGKFGFPFWNLEPADWDRVLRVNLLGAVHTAHAFAPSLVEQQRGTMLFISSVAGQIGSQTDPPYSSAKAGLLNFAQVAAKDLAPHQVRVNTICPGMVQTPLNRAVWQAWNDRQPDDLKQTYDQWAGSKVKQMCPLGQWQTPEDIANLAVFLASDRARNITGQTMNVDGGWVMHW